MAVKIPDNAVGVAFAATLSCAAATPSCDCARASLDRTARRQCASSGDAASYQPGAKLRFPLVTLSARTASACAIVTSPANSIDSPAVAMPPGHVPKHKRADPRWVDKRAALIIEYARQLARIYRGGRWSSNATQQRNDAFVGCNVVAANVTLPGKQSTEQLQGNPDFEMALAVLNARVDWTMVSNAVGDRPPIYCQRW